MSAFEERMCPTAFFCKLFLLVPLLVLLPLLLILFLLWAIPLGRFVGIGTLLLCASPLELDFLPGDLLEPRLIDLLDFTLAEDADACLLFDLVEVDPLFEDEEVRKLAIICIFLKYLCIKKRKAKKSCERKLPIESQ